ncbi:MAG: hypothetical protein ABIL09_25935, partial [Gemmatimonadota bacterium]
SNPAASSEYAPARLPVGPLEISAWLPAGLGQEVRLDETALGSLGLTHLEWLQRAERDGASAEELAMRFCSGAGLKMPVYYEPPGYSPYDKLRNWATREQLGVGYDDSLRARVAELVGQWSGEPGLAGYLVGHEDYRWQAYPALARTVARLREQDALRPAYTVGHIDAFPRQEQFLEAFFPDGGPANVLQHEHYVFRAGVPDSGAALQRRLEELAQGYGRAARAVQGRNGRWQAIVQAHAETRGTERWYRQPGAAELRVQVGLALARGAAGVVYFLYSSGTEEVRDARGEVREVRRYQGLVEEMGEPTALYAAARQLNADLARLSAPLEPLHFHGGYRGDRLPAGAPLSAADRELDVGLFGDGDTVTHVLVVNLRTWEARRARLRLPDRLGRDAVTGERLGRGEVEVDLEAGGFRLLELASLGGAERP